MNALANSQLGELQKFLGANAKDGDDRSLFAFKLHQFLGNGDTAYVTLQHPARVTLRPNISARPGRALASR